MFEPYGRALAEAMGELGTPCEVSVCGHSGKTASEMVGALDTGLSDMAGLWGKGLRRILQEDGPWDLVLLMAGTNDIGYGHALATIVEDVCHLHSVCHELGVSTVLLPPPGAPCGRALWNARRRHVKLRLQEFAESMPKVACVVDPARILPVNAGRTSSGAELWDSDGLHFSPAGSRQLGRGMASRVLRSLRRPRRASAPSTPPMCPPSAAPAAAPAKAATVAAASLLPPKAPVSAAASAAATEGTSMLVAPLPSVTSAGGFPLERGRSSVLSGPCAAHVVAASAATHVSTFGSARMPSPSPPRRLPSGGRRVSCRVESAAKMAPWDPPEGIWVH